ncbi:MAG TPA: glycoside hydrolase domain-containing protein, partial [Inquilinus sp.]|nr:glycoside hydrolase domain-containing protein [Inquilinus sp.]
MHEIIDVPSNVASFSTKLAEAGVKSVIRYYNHRNSEQLPSKALTRPELQALHGAGLSVAVVFQQRGGAGGNIGDLDARSGARDSSRALELADSFGQPEGSAIYFSVDWDYFRSSELDRITPYFQAVRNAVSPKYRIGVYGSGTVGRHLTAHQLVDHVWLAGATGWSGTAQALRDGNWTLFQKDLEKRSEIGGFIYDGNVFNPGQASFGQFGPDQALPTPRGEAVAALYKVIARRGLNLRHGPGESFAVRETLPEGRIVTGRGRDGPWLKVDIEGDGTIDGCMFAAFLEPVSGGLPIDPPPSGETRRPIDVARAELALNVQEIPGAQNNPRIVMYHATTSGGAAPDETAWCSSFVNYCVEQTGLRGTDSKWAM